MIGILAYGSLIVSPGEELEAVVMQVMDNIKTPFEVEYARSSSRRAGAPSLIIVPDGRGAAVKAKILVLERDFSLTEAKNMLYRREIDNVGDPGIMYPEGRQPGKNKILIDELHQFAGLDVVLYTRIGINLPIILDRTISVFRKANHLAELAVDSLTLDTYRAGRDGIQYLLENMDSGIITPLTESYCQHVLLKTNSAKDLSAARTYLAKQQGLYM